MIPMGAGRRRRRERTLLSAFLAAGATDMGNAKPLLEMGLEDTGDFRRLAEAGLFRETSPGRWYLDPEAAADRRDGQRRRAWIAAIVGALAAAAAALAGSLAHRGQ